MGAQLRGALTGCIGTAVRRTRRRLRPAPRRSENGAAAVEFALIAVPLITLLVGIVQVSILLWAYQAGSHAAGEGVRRLSVDACGAYSVVVKDRLGAASTNRDDTTVTTTFDPVRAKPQVGDKVTVRVNYPVAVVTGGLIPGMPSRMTQEASARVEDVDGC